MMNSAPTSNPTAAPPTLNEGEPRLTVTRADRRVLRLPWSALLRNKAYEYAVKLRGRRIKGQGLIAADHAAVVAGFAALRGDDFHRYNLPQAWVERRQIPAVLHGRVPLRRATILDLGCGPGTSTEILCHFADPSWTIIGFDLTPHLVDAARDRAARGGFRNRAGEVITPEFHRQDLSEPLLRDGAPLADASVDLAISGGVVGLYMHEPEARRLAAELRRVVRPGGFVALDAGPSLPGPALRRVVTETGFSFVSLAKSFWIEPRPKLIFLA